MTNESINNQSYQTLVVDFVENILRYADNPGESAEYITSQIRELVGVRMVGLVSIDEHLDINLLSICPPRKVNEWNHPEIQNFVISALSYKIPRFVDPATELIGKSLSAAGIGKSFIIPLQTGVNTVGMLFLLDLMNDEGNIKSILLALTKAAPVLALILKNSLLYKSLEHKVHERTEDLHLKNEELRESEKRFRNAIEEAPFPIMIHAENGEVVALSRAWIELSGYTLADIPTIAVWTERAYGIDKEPVIEEINLLYNLKRRKAEGEYTIKCNDGSLRIWEFSSVSLGQLPDGRRIAMSMAADVTDRKLAEIEIRETKALLQAAMDCSPAGIAIANAPDGRLRYVNDAGLFMRGGDRKDVVNGIGIDQYVASWQLLDLDGRPLRTDEVPLARAIIFGAASSREFIIRRDDNEDRIVFANAAPIRDEAGIVIAAIVVFTDVTERKQIEEQLASLTYRLQLATSSAQLGIWDWNVKENIMVWDDRMFELYGVTRESFPSSIDAWLNGLHPEDKEASLSECQAALNGEKEFDTEFRVQHPDGSVRYIKGKGLVVRDQGGNADRMIGINYDITVAKYVEEEKFKLESQLQQAQKMESVGRLAGGIAHDFNNMLSVILGHAELGLMHLDPTHPVCADLKEISKTAQRSADLTRQLLAFARKQTVAPKVLDLNVTVAEMLKMLKRLIGEDILLVWQPAPDLWQIRMDPSQVDQILANLCVNARDAIDGTGSITIETTNRTIDAEYCFSNLEATPGEYVCLTVSDSGIGMDKETQAHIFEPFYTTKELGKGTGLGLATVYGAIKQNNGFINIYSEPGQGTAFSIHIPRDENSRSCQALAGNVAAQVPRGQETILLVEDEPAILNIAAIMLEKQGYTVLKADNPGEAVRLAREHSGEIQLLMTDVIMPEMNGRDLAKNLLSIYPYMKRLFMSGYTADVIANHGVLEEGVHFIQKPFSLQNMAAKVREVLDSK